MTDTTTHEAALRELTAAVRELTAALAARPTYTINVSGAMASRADIQAAIAEANAHAALPGIRPRDEIMAARAEKGSVG